MLDGFNPNEPLLEFLRSQGVTVIHAVPGRANVIAGQTGIFRTSGRTAEKMALRFPAGMLINLGEAPKSAYSNKLADHAHGHREPRAHGVRPGAEQSPQEGRCEERGQTTGANAKLDALGLALDGKIPVIFAAHRADDLSTALRLAKEFNLKARLDLATEGYLMADIIAAAKVPVVVHPTMQRAGEHGDVQQLVSATRWSWRTKRFRWRSALASRVMYRRRACCATKRRWRW